MHHGAVATFAVPAGGVGYYPLLAQQISERICAAPRYRQKLCRVPGGFANQTWVDDPDFDLGNHVRHSALPQPGSDAQLCELVARIQSRQLDHSRPLWELHVVHGLSDNRFALITKIHHAMADGDRGLDIARLFFDSAPTVPPKPAPTAAAGRAPSPWRRVAEAALDLTHRPTAALAALSSDRAGGQTATAKALWRVRGWYAAARTLLRPAPDSPLNTTIGTPRRYATAGTRLADYQRVRQAHGVTINDVVLATVTGALRGWLQQRGEPVPPTASLRVMMPVNVRTEQQVDTLGKNVSASFVDLPLGEADPLRRLGEICDRMQRHNNAGPSAQTDVLIRLASLLPPPLRTRGASLAGGLSRRLFNVVVTNVAGPQIPLDVAGARMRTLHPVAPLATGQALSIGLISYNGGIFYGLNADRDSTPDLDRLAAFITQSLQELIDTVPRLAHRDIHIPGVSPRLADPDGTGPVEPSGRVA